MTAERWQRLKSLFDQAVALDSRVQSEFIREAAGGDPEMEASLRTLVGRHDSAATLLSGPLISEDRMIEYLAAGARTFREGELIAGRFRIERFLAEGGMGEVYIAVDLELGERIALKTLRPALAAEDSLMQRFRVEIQMARKVTHPNVCRVYDFFRHEAGESGIAFLTMELVEGSPLDKYIRERGRLSESEALPLLRQMVSGLEAAHEAGIVHRDFKSGNVLLSNQGGEMRLAITDFGLAQSIEKSRTAPSTRGIEGTPAYLAPEQLTGGAITPATDVYALGVVLFEMLTGELPFERSDSWQQALDIRQRPPRVRSRQRKVSAVWDAAIAACMQQDARRRPERVTKVLRQVTGGLLTRRQAVAAGVATSVFVAGGLEARYLFRDPAIPAEALQAFKRGETFAQRRTEEGLKNSVEEFQQAVRFYPRYANAWVGLADAYSALANYGYMAPRDALGRAREAAAQALAIDDRFAQAQGIYGRILSLDVSQWLKAEPFLRRAVSLEPTNASLRLWYGAYLGKLRRRREAMEQIRAGLDQAPSSMPLNHQLATELFWERRFSEFLRQAEALARLQPYEAGSHLVRARALEWAGRYDDALSACDEADRLKPTQTGSCYRASALAARGDTGGAFRIVGRVREYWNRNPFESALLAGLYAQLGDVPQAMEVVAEGYRRYDSTVLTIPCNPYFDKYRGAAQYRDFLKRIGGPADREITGG